MALKSTQFEPEKAEQIEESLDELDKTLDRLKVLYEQYFLGIQKQAPSYIHTDVERKIRELTQLNIRNTGLRYRFNTLQQKFGSYNSYWRRTLRQIEHGTYTRNLSKIGRKAARSGDDIPDEILAAMPKRMRDQVVRDRDAALALAKRQKLPIVDEPAAAVAFISEPSFIRREVKNRDGAFLLDDNDDFDIDSMFALATSDAGVLPMPTPPAAPTPAPALAPKPRTPPPIPTSARTGPIPVVSPSTQTSVIPMIPVRVPMPVVPSTTRTGPMPVVPPRTSQIPVVPPIPNRARTPSIAPSQQSRPIPIAPGSTARTGLVPVQSVGGRAVERTQTGPTPTMRPPPGMSDGDVDALYTKYVAAKKMVGEDASGAGARDKLLRTINAQAPKIMEQYKAKGVDFSVVVKDNQVIIRAKPKP